MIATRPTRHSWLAVGLLVAVVLAGTLWQAQSAVASEGEAQVWRQAKEIRENLFAAGQALKAGSTEKAIVRLNDAESAYRGELHRTISKQTKSESRRVVEGFEQARSSASAGDSVGLAAARGQVQSALLVGSYRVTLNALKKGNHATAASWLRVREFRKATRFTRPDASATVALEELANGRITTKQATLAAKKDLLDALQGRMNGFREQALIAKRRSFDPRGAELAHVVAGYWRALSPEYSNQFDPEEAKRIDRLIERFAIQSTEPGRNQLEKLDTQIERYLSGFSAAPYTQAEQARRASQLLRFLDLVPIEYNDGTNDGRVTVPFEIQEAVAFIDGADSALVDLTPTLLKFDQTELNGAKLELDRLKRFVNDASTGTNVVDLGTVEASHKKARSHLEAVFPKEWLEPTSDSDFDLIELTLDRMVTAFSEGQFKQAEQARLEAYAFFEFGPELRLKPFDPALVADIEGLIWFSGRGEEGLAKLIAQEGALREFRQTRSALDEALGEAQSTLGDSSSSVTVVTNTAIIVFREGLEAILILAALTAALVGQRRSLRKPVLYGSVAALFASALMWVAAQTLLTSLSQYGERLEAIVGLVAVGVLLVVMNWFFHKVYWTGWIKSHNSRKTKLLGAATGGLISAQVIGLALLGFTSVFREGFETVLFLQALQLSAGTATVLQGVGLGLLAVALVAVITFLLEKKLPYKRMLIVTGVMIGLVLVVMVGQTVRTLQGVGWMPISPIDIDVPYWLGTWFGVFPTWETTIAQILAITFVVGSYFVAEYVRVWKPRRKARREFESSNEEARDPTPEPSPELTSTQ